MNTLRLLGVSLILTGAVGAAFAQAPVTRAQVKAELAQAIRDGDVQIGDSGRTLREEDPSHYPKLAQAPGLTRAQVKAELAEAVREGDVQVGDSGRTLAELDPSRYPHPAQPAGLTRAQVKTELAQAIRDGDIEQGDSGETLAQEFPQRYAAARVRDGESRFAKD